MELAGWTLLAVGLRDAALAVRGIEESVRGPAGGATASLTATRPQ